ncbi:glucose-6-phosphate isomerase [Brevibacterium otitidis]|uniref:Glucose-6-phosphate isomerase n=1 Tax=Brevibacterium otitidis TaxID=53364 RepID=A0ABV5X430_9MICO|nr:glucose-6-phosphate isomerase [Brevibacterium otitidis]
MTLSLGYPSPAEFDDEVRDLVTARAASRITSGDHTLWGEAAEEEAAKRLGWVRLPDTSVELLDDIARLREELVAEGIDHVTLCGMGGSSLAPEVICATAGVFLEVVDTTDPSQIAEAIGTDLERSVVVVASKSGSTIETESQRRAFVEAFEAAGIPAASRMVVVTDPGSPLGQLAEREGYRRVFYADPTVGGRFSALSAFGLVPAGLAGADIAGLLAEAREIAPQLAEDSADNPALRLGAFLGVAHARDTDKLVIADTTSPIVGLGAWLEQLLAESTGKDGEGILPVVVEGPQAPGFADARADALLMYVGEIDGEAAPPSGFACAVDYPLGAQFLLWEYVTAITGFSIGINPFDQPDVEAAKASARALLAQDSAAEAEEPLFTDGAVEVYGSPHLLEGVDSVEGALRALAATADEYGYLAIQAFLDRLSDRRAELIRQAAALRTGLQTTLGWGPRYLHSTGQYHKGGRPNGVFLQITGSTRADVLIPDESYSFGQLQAAQAAGDADVLTDRGRPVVRMHLRDRAEGISEILAAFGFDDA